MIGAGACLAGEITGALLLGTLGAYVGRVAYRLITRPARKAITA